MISTFRKYLTPLFPIIVLILLLTLLLSRVFRPGTDSSPEISISYTEAYQHAGDFAEVCGEVQSSTYTYQIGGEPTFLNFGDEYPQQLFTVVIWGNNLSNWSTPPAELYTDSYICVSGTINIHNGIPQIVISHPGSISRQPRYR